MNQTIRLTLRLFRANRDGSVALCFAFAVAPVLAMLGSPSITAA